MEDGPAALILSDMLAQFLIGSLLSAPSPAPAGIVLDSASRHRPQLRLQSLAANWVPDALGRAETSNRRLPRGRLQEASAPFVGNWVGDFAAFKRMWPKAVADGSWQFLVTGFWRAVQGLNTDFGDPPSRAAWPGILDAWDAWVETVDPSFRATLGEMTSTELCRPGRPYSLQAVAPGSRYSVDLSPARVQGTVVARVQRYVRKGLSFGRLVPMPAPAPWTPKGSEPWSVSLPEPGLYRIVLRSEGWYQQFLVQATEVGSMAVPTDSGSLVWAPGGKGRKWLVWKTAAGKVDSAPIGDAPLHVGLAPSADSGLVGVACGQDLSILRLRRPRTAQGSIVFGSKDKDWYGRPAMSAPRPESMSNTWSASLVATPDAVEPGALVRVAGLVRRAGPYGLPDSARADSVELRIDTGRGPSVHRNVATTPSGLWADSIVVRNQSSFTLERVWSRGKVVVTNACKLAMVRVRDTAAAVLPGRASFHSGGSRPAGAVEHRLQPDSSRLVLLASGKALDWKYPVRPGDTVLTVPPQAAAAGGWSVERLDARGPEWTHERAEILFDPPKGEGWMPLTVAPGLPDSVQAGSAIALSLRPRLGAPSPAEVFLAVGPDTLAGELGGMAEFLGRAWARSEMSFPDQRVNALGINNMGSVLADFDEETEPNRFARLGILTFPGPCVRCRPWTGSFTSSSAYGYEQPCSIGYSYGPAVPAAARLPGPDLWAGPFAVGTDGRLPDGFRWPIRPGRYRVQLWGIDASGRVLAWEKAVAVR